MRKSSTFHEVLRNIRSISWASFSFVVPSPQKWPAFQYSESDEIIRTSPLFLSILIF